MPVYAYKDLPISVSFKNGIYNSSNVSVKITPEIIRVKGDVDALADMNQYTVVIDEKNVSSDITVSEKINLPKGIENVDSIETVTIEIKHKNGYVTKYKHLGDILVRKGQKVKQGAVIGRVGVTGMSFAPHLHYEVWLNDQMMDPMNYYFGTVTPQMFMDMAVIVANTGQSLD